MRTIGYRFLGLVHRDYDVTTAGGPGLNISGKQKLDNDFDHSLLVGIRYNFVAPPLPPSATAAPVAAAARPYLVFFDRDKAILPYPARAIVKEPADNFARAQYTRIEVNGYTDTSGNQALSLRRVRTAAAEPVRNGLAQNAITVQGFAETHLLVSTGPGIREPQNRRVEIIIR